MCSRPLPFDPEGGTMYVRETLRVLDKLGMTRRCRQGFL